MRVEPSVDRSRRAVEVSGVVQGVGFRPFVFGLASRLGLRGFVQNRVGTVVIEVEGEPDALDQFVAGLEQGPALARVDAVRWAALPVRGDGAFRIEESAASGASAVFVSPDVATCDDCLRELFDPSDRRYRYPFINCTSCGPRLTIVRGAPYDRALTTMASFEMCAACRAEYQDPADRRFHAQPIACARCGPVLRALDGDGAAIDGVDPLPWAAAQLGRGGIVAVKGLGGWHLACDARDPSAVYELRRRKQRDEKPFAVMVLDLAAAEAVCEISAPERELLRSTARPITLLRRRAGACLAEAVAPDDPRIGLMLPYTPLHHLLLREVAGPLVMTSGNRSDEPIAYEDDDARKRLRGIADAFLSHDRPIHSRCDDSVVRVVSAAALPIRRSRGYAPLPLELPAEVAVPTLALGGELKATFALAQGKKAIVSHHLGDLEHAEAYRAYLAAIDAYEQLYRISPGLLVHDLHPDYASTRYAPGRGLPTLAVQHHHAHMASCMAENGLSGPAIGVCFDGLGFGTDGTLWGGEFLTGGYASVERAAHLAVVPMPGGERAIREPWRMAVSHLRAAGEDLGALCGRIDKEAIRVVDRMLEREFNSPHTSSMGRLFDAVAAIAGVCDRMSFEGQAAMRLESLAAGVPPDGSYDFEVEGLSIQCAPIIREVAREVRRGTAREVIARRFHSTVVEIAVQTCERLRTASTDVVLSGGVFMNAILLHETMEALSARGLRAFRHHLVPPNDGGLCLGQLAVAAARESSHEVP